jgi:hypothetical protein
MKRWGQTPFVPSDIGHVDFREFLKFVVVLTDVLNIEAKMLRMKNCKKEEMS